METRKEYKFVLNNFELHNFFLYLNGKEKTLHKDRTISSLYMDTIGFKLFNDSKLNDIDKFKVRYRQYNNKGPVYFEEKFNSANGRFKRTTKSKEITELSNINKLFYKNLNLLPALKISYKRKYLIYKNTRVTIDKQLVFTSCRPRTESIYSFKSNFNIVEYKILTNDRDIEKNFFKNPISFSKYNYGLEQIYNLN